MIQCHPSDVESNMSGHRIPRKKGLDIDLNQEYIPSHYSSNSSSLAGQQGGSDNPAVAQPRSSKHQEYVYRPRKAESQYSQKPSALHTRKRMQFIRENDKESLDAYLEREKKRLAQSNQTEKRLTRQHGVSMRTNDRKLKEARAKRREGTASKEELELVEKKNNWFRQYRLGLKNSGVKRKKDTRMQEARKKIHEGTATKAQRDMVEKKRLDDKERYQRKKAQLSKKV